MIHFEDGSKVSVDEFCMTVRAALSEGLMAEQCPDVGAILRDLEVSDFSYPAAEALASNESVRVWLGKHVGLRRRLQALPRATRAGMLRNLATRHADQLPSVHLDAVDWECLVAEMFQ